MSDWSRYLDEAISNMSRRKRVIYFKSENRRVIEEAVNQSSALRAKIGISGEEEHTYRHMLARYQCMDMTRLYQSGGVIGTVKIPEGRKSGTEEKVKLIPKAAVLTDFQVFSEIDRGKMIKAFLDSRELKEAVLLISSPELLIPDGLSGEIEMIGDRYITPGDIYERLLTEVRKEEEARGRTFFQKDEDLKAYVNDFVGMTGEQVKDILDQLRDSLCPGLLEGEHKKLVKRERVKEAEKDGAIRFIELDLDEKIAGLGGYEKWLDERKEDFADPATARKQGTPAPKGVLLCGIPGTGKTAMARETARRYQVPLLQFDLSRIQSSKLGESEARLSRYLDRISAFGSCVMLMDEVEKMFSVNDNTHEVKLAMLGQLLDWMQSRKANVLTFITANNISKLPPELLRDGRISGRFFAFMPSRNDLAAIMRVKLKRLCLDQEALGGGMFNSSFQAVILKELESGQEMDRDPLARILDRIAEDAEKRKEQGEIRWPFMTGANLETLIEMTNRELRSAKIPAPYSYETYSEQMCRCALSPSFIPQGQSNMKEVVEMWIGAQERQYQDVSLHTLLPFSWFQDGKFTQEIVADNSYDRFLGKVLKERIEGDWEKTREQEAAVKKYAQNQQ